MNAFRVISVTDRPNEVSIYGKREYMWERQPAALIDEINRTRNILEGRMRPISLKSLWKTWFDENLDFRVAEAVANDVKNVQLAYLKEARNELNEAIPVEMLGSRLVPTNNPHRAEETLLDPSILSLTVMKWTTQVSLSHNRAYHHMLRLLDYISKGVYGSVYKGGLRYPGLDRGILAILSQSDGNLTSAFLELLLKYVKNQPGLVAVKETETIDNTLIQEYKVLQEVSSYLLNMGIYAVPTPYAYTNRYSKFHDPTLNDRIISSDFDYAYSSQQLFMQYISGPTLNSVSLTSALANAVFGYIHSVLGLLETSLGYNHNDLWGSNVILWGYGKGVEYVLPVYDNNASLLFNIRLPFRPILIDMGLATTNNYVSYTALSSPNGSNLQDMISLYTRTPSASITHGYDKLVDILRTVFSEFKPGAHIEGMFVPPYGLIIPNISHSGFLQYYIDTGSFIPFITSDAVSEGETLQLSVADKTEYEELKEEAKDLLDNHFHDTTELHAAVRHYLRETIDYYSL
jgi:hypothetical protein